MIRGVLSALSSRLRGNLSSGLLSTKGNGTFVSKSLFLNQQNANFTSLTPLSVVTSRCQPRYVSEFVKNSLLEPPQVQSQQIRTVIKFSIKKGKRKSVAAVRKRFFRLHWGIWIRTIAGRHKKLWKKNKKRRNFYLNHVLCNATQSRMLDKMVNQFWKRPKYYIEDPYEVYHKRENFYITQTKPWRPEGVDYE